MVDDVTRQKELSLKEIIKDYSLRNVARDFADNLSISELLVIGSRPFDLLNEAESVWYESAINSGLAELHEVIIAKVANLENMRNTLLNDIVEHLYPDETEHMRKESVTSYLGIYEFFTRPYIITTELENAVYNSISDEYASTRDRVRAELTGFREAFQKLRDGEAPTLHSPYNTETLMNTHVNLLCYYHHPNENQDDRKLFVTQTKTKEFVRIANKVLYQMMEIAMRDMRYSFEKEFAPEWLRLEDCRICDIAGLMFVVAGFDDNTTEAEINRIKQYITTSSIIEIVPNKDGELMAYYRRRDDGSYSSLHINLLWNPEINNPQALNPHIDTVECKLTAPIDYVRAEFGPTNHYQRMLKQRIGIVGKELVNGVLPIREFDPKAKYWKDLIAERHMTILNYRG